jgi:glycosyltransferase involved in cell wall biosynthesis
VKLLLVIYGPLSSISGGYLYDRKITSYLRAHGARVDILAVKRLPYPFCRLQLLNPRLRQFFRREVGYDALIVDELTFPSLCDLAANRRPRTTPLAVLVHHLAVSEAHPPLPRSLAARLERRLLNAADAALVNSRTTAATVRALLPAEKPVSVCPPGCDGLSLLPSEEKARDEAGPARLLITGNIIPRKGHHLLLKILAGLKDLSWELRVVGRAPERRYRRRLAEQVRSEGLGKRVVFTGALDPQALAREYSEADIFVFPSSYEGFGISLAEAVRAGLPCVAFDSGAIAEWAGGADWLLPAGDLAAFNARLDALIRDPALRRRAAAASRRLAPGLPTWEQTGRCFLTALKALTARPMARGEDSR